MATDPPEIIKAFYWKGVYKVYWFFNKKGRRVKQFLFIAHDKIEVYDLHGKFIYKKDYNIPLKIIGE